MKELTRRGILIQPAKRMSSLTRANEQDKKAKVMCHLKKANFPLYLYGKGDELSGRE
jgi:hypothetical protein